jgi:hypothetical protein
MPVDTHVLLLETLQPGGSRRQNCAANEAQNRRK